MKILITTDTYYPMINGVIASVNNLYNELKLKGHQVKILTLSHDSKESIQGDIYYLKSIGIGVYPDARIKFPLHNRLISEILRWNPDIIHSQTEFSMMLVSKYISNKLHIPIIHTYHTMYEDYLGYVFGGRLITKRTSAKFIRMLLNSLDSVIAPTQKAKDSLISYGVNTSISVIPSGISLKNFKKELLEEEKRKIKKYFNISKDDRIIAYVGRIGQEKNIGEIIDFMDDLIGINRKIKLLVVGDGPYLQTLKKEVIEKKIEKSVIFTGMIKSEEVYKYYKIAEIFVTASTSETQGLTYIEALSSGCPVVCKYDPCIDGVIKQGENGFAYRSRKEYVHYINKILNDYTLRCNMKQSALNKANEYSSEIFGNRVLYEYYRVLKNTENIEMDLTKVINHKT
ncbi:glycosyltransferase family 4 protein [Clostridium manihotivorum]|uniref:Glycosyltransferase family 4 protein n=1 Tax=Clostridium manihotivorum TaxID=2320868 RepID=A0A3R5QT95_9CLOT|nr:glycosyltransferase family 4 protein [Clostridium manihotivorum]QAA31951.1 glycosyltransferase family 4 protein [Clostridium manihotivorum]